MDGFVATKLDDFERGKISRRRLIETLTLAATTAYAADGASAQKADPKLKIALINHTLPERNTPSTEWVSFSWDSCAIFRSSMRFWSSLSHFALLMPSSR